MPTPSSINPRVVWLLRLLWALVLLYLFLVGIKLLETSIKTMGQEFTNGLLDGIRNPFAALAAGILVTVLVQSSSASTSMIVALVAAGKLPVDIAVPMIMGANIGTSVTSTLVSLGHVGQREEFRRAYAGATVHDFFNLITVAILLPLNLISKSWSANGQGFLERMATYLTTFLPQDSTGENSKSFVKVAVGWLKDQVSWIFKEGMGLSGSWLGAALLVTALLVILVTLYFITKNMRILMADQIERWLNRALRRSVLLGWGIGIVITVLVQSSSITTSLLVPMFGAGVLALDAGFPILVGANIGTTITALLASLVVTTNQEAAMQIAMVHLLFNCFGSLMFLPIPRVRRIPINCAEWLAAKAAVNKLWVLGYLFGVFVLLPAIGFFLWN